MRITYKTDYFALVNLKGFFLDIHVSSITHIVYILVSLTLFCYGWIRMRCTRHTLINCHAYIFHHRGTFDVSMNSCTDLIAFFISFILNYVNMYLDILKCLIKYTYFKHKSINWHLRHVLYMSYWLITINRLLIAPLIIQNSTDKIEGQYIVRFKKAVSPGYCTYQHFIFIFVLKLSIVYGNLFSWIKVMAIRTAIDRKFAF